MYPLSFCFLLLISTFLVINIEQFLSEKRFHNETETILKQEFYYLSSVKKLENQLQEDANIGQGGFSYQDGRVEYTKEDLGTTIKFTLVVTLSSGVQVQGYSYYDKNLRKMVKWEENK